MSRAQKITVLLADDHLIVREGLRSTLKDFPIIRVVGEAKDGKEAIQKVETLSPNVVLMDINMPHMNGLEATSHIRKHFPDTKILAMTVHDSRQYVTEMFRCGAHGYILKDTSPDELAHAIQSLCEEKAFVSPAVARHLIENIRPEAEVEEPPSRVTEREKQILKLLSTGNTSKEMAIALGLSVRSIETFRLRLMRKLRCHNAAQLTKYALEHKLLS